EEGLRCLAPLGHLILYGRAGGPTDPLNVATLSPKSVKISGFMVPTVTRNFPDKTRESAERCFALMREGRLRLHIGKTFPLAAAAEAHRYLESRQSTRKLVLIPWSRSMRSAPASSSSTARACSRTWRRVSRGRCPC